MRAMQLLGHGGPEMLKLAEVPVPTPAHDEVLVRVGAAGVNNTDINTRIGWYSKSIEGATGDGAGFDTDIADGGWNGGLSFPRIQGADVAGTVVAVGDDVDPSRVGQRVILRSMHEGPDGELVTVGSELDGGFAEYCAVRSEVAFAIECDLTDAELASFPCAFSTAEAMLHRADVAHDDRVLITGASGGVGSAAIQLARRRGADVIAVASRSKWPSLEPWGAQLIDRNDDLVGALGSESVDVVIDVVAGSTWPALLDVLRIGGRYVASGAIAGPMVELDVRTLYLKDLSLLGSTRQPPAVFENLVGYIERGEIEPMVAAQYELSELARAQERFLRKDFVGNLVVVP